VAGNCGGESSAAGVRHLRGCNRNVGYGGWLVAVLTSVYGGLRNLA